MKYSWTLVKDVAWRDIGLSHTLPIEEKHVVLRRKPSLGFGASEKILSDGAGLRAQSAQRIKHVRRSI